MKPMTTLAQLQQEWRAYAERITTNDFLKLGTLVCADQLEPFISQESAQAAQREADRELLSSLTNALDHLSHEGCENLMPGQTCGYCELVYKARARLSEDSKP